MAGESVSISTGWDALFTGAGYGLSAVGTLMQPTSTESRSRRWRASRRRSCG
jgi:hypothetical protein